MNFIRKPLPDRGLKVVAQLEELDVKIAKPITIAIDHYKLVNSRKPERPSDEDLAGAYYDPEPTDEDRERLALQVSTISHARSAWAAALDEAGDAVQRALAAEIDNIVEALRPLAEEAIGDITWYVAEGQPDLAALLRDGRPEEAQRAAGVMTAWGRFLHLTKVRDASLGRRKFQWSIWRNADWVDNLDIRGNLDGFDRVVHTISKGGELAWTSYEEAQETASNRAQAERARAAAEQRRQSLQKQSAL